MDGKVGLGADEIPASGYRELSFAGMDLAVLPEILSSGTRMEHLISLNLKENKLWMLPSEVFLRVPNLECLRANSNKLGYLPETMGVLRKLRVLNLRSNCLQALPDALFRLTQLENLDLGCNSLEGLPASIRNLGRLKRLDVANNRIVEVPNEVTELPMLKHIDISGNPVQRMPLTVQRMQTKGELLRSKEKRRRLVERALHVRTSVKNAYQSE
ncbi:unnamed protein product, partial [Discosporangium mesarthrocarpum]